MDEPAVFCGRCGTRVDLCASSTVSRAGSDAEPGPETMAALLSSGAKRSRLVAIVIVDLALLGAGGSFIARYLLAPPRALAQPQPSEPAAMSSPQGASPTLAEPTPLAKLQP